MDWAQLISQVGFPIAVSAWLLIRLDDRLGAFEKTAVAICQRLEDQMNRCNECKEWRARNEKVKARCKNTSALSESQYRV